MQAGLTLSNLGWLGGALKMAIASGPPVVGTTWTSRSSAADNTWVSVAYGAGVWAAVASNASDITKCVMTSPDGITWTLRTTTAKNWNAIIFANSQFVAVGLGQVMTSPDGITWTDQTAANGNNWQAVAWNGTVYVAVADDGTLDTVMSSTNGVLWTVRVPSVAATWRGIAWNGTVFSVVSADLSGNLMTSANGIAWTTRTAAGAYSWQAVAWSASLSLFAAVGAVGGGNDHCMTSSDGITWTLRTTNGSSYTDIAFGGTLFVAVASDGGTTCVMTSSDGITWTLRTTPNQQWMGVGYNGSNQFVGVAQNGSGNRVMTSL